jgi:hypothetical protein
MALQGRPRHLERCQQTAQQSVALQTFPLVWRVVSSCVFSIYEDVFTRPSGCRPTRVDGDVGDGDDAARCSGGHNHSRLNPRGMWIDQGCIGPQTSNQCHFRNTYPIWPTVLAYRVRCTSNSFLR